MSEQSSREHYRSIREPITDGVNLARAALGESMDQASLSAARYAAYKAASDLLPDVLEDEKAADDEERIQLTDHLTGLDNVYGLYENLQTAVQFAERHNIPLALVLIYFTNLKNINDYEGHQAGDRALVGATDILIQHSEAILTASTEGQEYSQALRAPARLESGNTFAIVRPNSTQEDAEIWWYNLDLALRQSGFKMQAAFATFDPTLHAAPNASSDFLHRGKSALYAELGEIEYEI